MLRYWSQEQSCIPMIKLAKELWNKSKKNQPSRMILLLFQMKKVCITHGYIFVSDLCWWQFLVIGVQALCHHHRKMSPKHLVFNVCQQHRRSHLVLLRLVDTLRLARWRSQQIISRLRDRQPITGRLESISFKSCPSNNIWFFPEKISYFQPMK